MTAEALLVLVFDALDALEISFMLSGSLASNFYGVPRATQDADLVLALTHLPIDAFQQRIGAHFDVDEQLAFEAVTGSRRLVARAKESAFQIELFDLIDDPHDRERFARRRTATVLGRRVSLPTAEDVVVSKLRWFRLAGRRKDWDDARNVMAVQRVALDQAYMRHWCADLATLDLLEAIERSLP